MKTTFALAMLLSTSTSTAAAETDPYYGWLHPPRDGTAALNAKINAELERGLRDLNRFPPRECREAAKQMAAPLSTTAAYYWAGSTRSWGVDHSPRTRTEYDERFRRESVYRHSALLPFGSLVPFDPTVRVGDVLFGTDKLGHFFTNGYRYYARYLAARAAGDDDDAATTKAIMTGVVEENGILGVDVSSIFSYGDLESNDAGMLWFRSLCEDDGGGASLVLKDGRWTLVRRFDISQYVDPCWDEGFYTSSFTPLATKDVTRALGEMCTELRAPALEQRRARYRERGCHSRTVHLLATLLKSQAAPAPLSLDDVCPAPAAPR